MGVPVVPDHQLKIPVVRRTEYTLHLEQATRQHCFIHCDVHVPWTSKVKSSLRADWTKLLELHGGPLLALHDPEDLKHQKFLRLFGFHKVESYRDPLGRPKEIYST